MNIEYTVYQSIYNPDLGFVIQKIGSEISLWKDEYEGGLCFIDDLTFEDNFESTELAYQYIIETYGEVIIIEV